jgi:DNA-binding NarL/FixJ family response regulator
MPGSRSASDPVHTADTRTVRVLTVDDQRVFREAAHALIESTPGFEPIGECRSGADAIAVAEVVGPDMVLLDVRMPDMDGIDTARRLREVCPGMVVVLVSGGDIEEFRSLAEASGAAALVVKEALTPRLLRKLWAAHGSH